MERRVTHGFPGPQPPPPQQAPYYHNNNYNNHHHQIHHNHVAAIGFQQYPQNDNRDQRFNQPTPQFDNHYPAQQQQQQQENMGVEAPPTQSSTSGVSPYGGSLRTKRRSLSSSSSSTPGGPDPPTSEVGISSSSIAAKLYVAPLPITATEYDVRQVFEKYGSVTEIILPKDKMSGERAAYCFVKYRKLEEGSAAIAALTDHFTFPGEISPVKVRYADAERERIGFSTVQLPDKLYVRCLNKHTTRMEVHEVFSRFGIIEDIYMAVDDMKISRGFAFVQFSRREMALEAIKALNGLFTMRGSDQPLIVRFADPKKPRLGEPRSNFNGPPATTQQLDSNWNPQPYPQWGNKEPAAPRVVQPNHFPQQNGQAVSVVQKQLHQDFEKHQRSETASVEARGDGQKISSSHSNAVPEDQNTESSECDWSEHTCPDGNKYYFHCLTGESTWEKPEEYSMFERWLEEQTRVQEEDQKGVSPQLNNQSQGEQVQSDVLQQTTKLQQPSLSTADQENNKVCPVLAVETTCS
ncbi:flowering time control protein FCA [Raphanus sativus]|uniref:Flowering time control protein FCA n=1 Tax=Raphanus sativus TaxID=3726 RepID=A0A6J0N0A2_RAPSA|nr:flowering time control protein FCA [Raphanus sativus]XP_018477424.1 flowering time control protein FCA [Raphanus sativus]